jgi:hypothetical protein
MLDNTITHADDEQEEEGEGVSACIEDRDYDHESLCAAIQAMSVLEF